MTPPRNEEEISSVGRVIDATLPLTDLDSTLPQANLSSASPSLSNLRAKNTTLLVPVTRGKTQKLFICGDATLSISLDSDDFVFGELPSLAAHRLNGWINFPLTATTTACFHGWNNPTRRVTLARDFLTRRSKRFGDAEI